MLAGKTGEGGRWATAERHREAVFGVSVAGVALSKQRALLRLTPNLRFVGSAGHALAPRRLQTAS